MKGLFVTGTDTGVGKTVVSAALMAAFPGASYWKPVQSGCDEDDDTATVRNLSGATPDRCLDRGVRLKLPASPHHAAEVEGTEIRLSQLLEGAPQERGPWIVEGAGGLMVPLSRTTILPDLIKALDLPTLIVSSTRLGTINHTLLTVAAHASLGLETVGLVLNGDHDPSATSGISAHTDVEILMAIPHRKELTPDFVRSVGGRLAQIPALARLLGGGDTP